MVDTMKIPKIKMLRFFCAMACIAGGACAISIYPFPLSEPNIIIETRHMSYACGECYVQERVTRVLDKDSGNFIDKHDYESESNTPFRYLGWDVVVNYKRNTDGLLNSLDTISRNGPYCAWPDFRLRGQFKRRIIYSHYFRGDHYDGIYFDTDDATAIYSSNMNCPEVKLP